VVSLHAITQDVFELAALLVPGSVLFGIGLVMALRPVVTAGGAKYSFRKLDLREQIREQGKRKNGNGNGNGHGTKRSPAFVKETPEPVRWEDWWN
jgi:hypothetical protein